MKNFEKLLHCCPSNQNLAIQYFIYLPMHPHPLPNTHTHIHTCYISPDSCFYKVSCNICVYHSHSSEWPSDKISKTWKIYMICSGAHGQIIYIHVVILEFAIFGTFMLLYQSPFYLFILIYFKMIFNPSLTI